MTRPPSSQDFVSITKFDFQSKHPYSLDWAGLLLESGFFSYFSIIINSNHEMNNESESHFDLNRFVTAQDGVYPKALLELRNGDKRGHWIWFILPQLAGLGKTATSSKYGIKDLDEAKAYLDHPLLGPRLLECCEALLAVEGKSALQIAGHPDVLKLRSCLTLFLRADPGQATFRQLLEKYYQGEEDPLTLKLLGLTPGEDSTDSDPR